MPQALVIDNVQFASQGMTLEGDLDLSELLRLAGEVLDRKGAFHYALSGKSGSRSELLLHLQLFGELTLRCQRCLQPLRVALDVDTTFELRDALDDDVLLQEDLEDDSRDYLSASRSMDLLSLIEDEVLLALPSAPRHESCAIPETRHDPEAASPFGMLQKLKGQTGKTH